MDRNKYLKRISYTGQVVPNEKTLSRLHENHVLYVPFGNLDVHYNKRFGLELNKLYEKVVVGFRGGFCYELNALFNIKLSSSGFKSYLIAARIFDGHGNLGPEYDHMCIYVNTGKKYLVDVGFGDLFTKPLEIKDGTQSDGRNLFKIERSNDQNFVLSMCSDQINFHKKYIFNLNEVQIHSFNEICSDKQTNPLSYFVKNTICTKPTAAGRLTLFNGKLTEKRDHERITRLVSNDDELRDALKTFFEIEV